MKRRRWGRGRRGVEGVKEREAENRRGDAGGQSGPFVDADWRFCAVTVNRRQGPSSPSSLTSPGSLAR